MNRFKTISEAGFLLILLASTLLFLVNGHLMYAVFHDGVISRMQALDIYGLEAEKEARSRVIMEGLKSDIVPITAMVIFAFLLLVGWTVFLRRVRNSQGV